MKASQVGRPPKGKAIERLRKALDAISELEDLSNGSPEFEKWCRDTEVAIENTFVGESRHIGDFKQIGYSPFVIHSVMAESEDHLAYLGGLKSAAALLES